MTAREKHMVEKRGASNSRYKLSKYKRISKKVEIKEIFNTGIKWECNTYRIIYKTNSLKNDRIAVLVSRKIGNACFRNKVKRIFKEIFRQSAHYSPPFLDILIQTKPGIKIEKSITNCFKQWQNNIKQLL